MTRSMDDKHVHSRFLAVTVFLCLVCPWGRAQEELPPLERLLELNELFGAPASVTKDQAVLRFPGKGAFSKAFAIRGARGLGFFSDEKDFKDVALRQRLIEGAKGQFSVVARDAGQAVSNFPLVGDLTIGFRLRIPNLPPNNAFNLTLHQQDSRNFVQIVGLREIVHVEGGKRRVKAAKERPYSMPLANWFDWKSPGVPFEISLKGGKLTVSMTIEGAKEGEKEKRVEIVSLDEVRNPDRGRIALEFANLSFLLTDLVIEGGWDRGWAEKEIAALRKAGKLRTGEPQVASPKPADAGKPGRQNTPDPFLPPRRELGPVDTKTPDPKAGEEL